MENVQSVLQLSTFVGTRWAIQFFRCQSVRSLRLQYHEEETIREDKLRSENRFRVIN